MLQILAEPGRLYVDRRGVASSLRAFPRNRDVSEQAAHIVCAWAADPTLRNRNAAALMLRALPDAAAARQVPVDGLSGVALPAAESDPPPADHEGWAPIAAGLRERASEFKFHIWLEPLELVARVGPVLWVRAPDHIRTWVSERYSHLITDVASDVLGERVTLELVDWDWRPRPAHGQLQEATR